MQKYAESCTVGVTHMPAGRGGNEDEISGTIVQTLARMGYQAAAHPIHGFGAGATGMSDIPLGVVVTIVRSLSKWISERLEAKRQREINALHPQCVVQLVVTANNGAQYGKPSNLAAGLFAILPAVLADLQEADYRRRYLFMIYASAPEYVSVTMNLYEDDMDNKGLLKLVRACEAKPRIEQGPAGATLNLSFVKEHWWMPKKVNRSVSPVYLGVNIVGQREKT
ncbi:hypothetical protein [Arthrobacter sp. MDT1-65]